MRSTELITVSMTKLAPEYNYFPMFLSLLNMKYPKANTTKMVTIGAANGRITPVYIPWYPAIPIMRRMKSNVTRTPQPIANA